MKKTILAFAILFAVGFTMESCKKEKKEDVKQEIKKERASNEVYQCPMDCEEGKSYTEHGQCPVCKMDLKAKKVDMDGDDQKHAANCKCKEGGECKCADGKCKCMEEKTAEACAKHPDGDCSCKAEKA